MPALAECRDAKDIIHLDHAIGWGQIFFEWGIEGKAEGLEHLMEIYMLDIPRALATCYGAHQYEKQNLIDLHK